MECQICLVSCVFKNFHWLRCLGLHFPISSYRRFMWSLFCCFYSWIFVSRILWSEGLCGTGLWSVGSPTDGGNCCVCLHCQPCAAVWAPSPVFPSVLLHIAAPLVLGLLRGPGVLPWELDSPSGSQPVFAAPSCQGGS